jgi:hypothetical protein
MFFFGRLGSRAGFQIPYFIVETKTRIALFVGLAYQVGKDIIVFRFIIEYSSLRDFGL